MLRDKTTHTCDAHKWPEFATAVAAAICIQDDPLGALQSCRGGALCWVGFIELLDDFCNGFALLLITVGTCGDGVACTCVCTGRH